MIYFLGKKFLGDDLFVYQQTIDALELKKTMALIMFLVGNQRVKYFLTLTIAYCLLAKHKTFWI